MMRRLKKTDWAKHNVTDADRKVARKLARKLDIMDPDPNGFEVFDIACALVKEREKTQDKERVDLVEYLGQFTALECIDFEFFAGIEDGRHRTP